jgi:hypothetical protein
MMRLYLVSGILLIVPIVNFAIAAPVLVQEKLQARVDMVGPPEYMGSVLGKRGRMWGEIEEVGGEYIEKWFAPPEKASAAHGSSISAPPPEPPPSADTHGSSISVPEPKPASSTETHESSISELAPSREFDNSLTGVNTQVLTTIRPAWFHPDNRFLGANAPQQNTRPSNPSTSDRMLVVEEPSSPTKESSTLDSVDSTESNPVTGGVKDGGSGWSSYMVSFKLSWVLK